MTGYWSRIGLVVDMTIGAFLAVFVNKIRVGTSTLNTKVGSAQWKTGTHDAAIHTFQDNMKRFEFHSVTAGASVTPEFYHDDIVITDEVGQTY